MTAIIGMLLLALPVVAFAAAAGIRAARRG